MGKVCLVNNIPCFREVVQDQFNGYICDNRNHFSYINRIKELIVNEKVAKMISYNASKTIQEKFSINSRAKNTIKIYNSLSLN